jgi:replicative DNA helicase
LIYRAIDELAQSDKPVDLYTVTDRLKSKRELTKVGGAAYLAQLTQRVGSAANVDFHARIIAQKYVQREAVYTTIPVVSGAVCSTISN